ncbi:putative small secreted protein [Kushneria sinocarnis]|uniref:Putative small secreted protein n=1 Tax=Kushneria sinocarnis TaxID=595502 RepID=A0A420WSW7_9GAMM|nr:entericidin A/B family lipoprotein [Kushneria sinocarnis]RKQ95860.1 putative small secreted protein [Kushneria sinocarnis]
MKKTSALLITLLLSGVAMSGCNTMEGAGEDISQGGEQIEDAAD